MATILTKKRVAPQLLLAASLALAPVAFAQSTTQSSSNGSQTPASTPAPAAQSGTSQQPSVPPTSTSAPTSSPQTKPDASPSTPAQTPPQPDAANAGAPSANTPPPNTEPAQVHVKQGSVEDVNAVGTRNIGGRGVGNWYSTEGEIKMGKQYADQIEKSTKLINDPVVTEYVNRIGQNIVKNSDCKVPFTIKVIDTDEINAMALPGGFFYVNSGLILAADEEAELAGVMAHETAHVCAHHAAREMTRMNYVQLGSIPLIMMTGYSWTGYGIYEAINIAIPMTFLMFSREFEGQADYLGVQYMYRAGYDPQAFVTFFEKIQNLEKQKPELWPRHSRIILRRRTALRTPRKRSRRFCQRRTNIL